MAQEAQTSAHAEGAGADPPYLYPDYLATRRRAPTRPLLLLPGALADRSGPVLGRDSVRPEDADLTTRKAGPALGERIIVSGQVRDSDGRPVRASLIELWQANAAGRYAHERDTHPAPLDPNFDGLGRVLTDDDGRYRFVTIRPGAYPWRNHPNAWRPAHIHFSVFGEQFPQRLITQMYFPGDQLFFQDPIFNSIPDERARQRLIARFDLDQTRPEWALAFCFDIVLHGRDQTPFEAEDDDA